MVDISTTITPQPLVTVAQRHPLWVRIAHLLVTISFLALLFSGYEILMVHPRLYWGNAGNDLTPALFELPVSRNYKHNGWQPKESFNRSTSNAVSASRTYEIFNQNGWGRSLHFLTGWMLVVTGLFYLLAGFFTGHFRQQLWPSRAERKPALLTKDFLSHFTRLPLTGSNENYGLLQKYTYLAVIFLLFPLVIMTGFTMSPAITAAYPFLLSLFGGAQSARTLHFFAALALVIFLIIHITMVLRSGWKEKIPAITLGK